MGRLHRVHRGVYAVGHPLLTSRGRLRAAVLACGGGAFVSHRSAAALWGILPTARTVIDVSSPTRAGRRHRGIDAHRGGTALPTDVGAVDGIPCATVARTLLDLAGVVRRETLQRAVEQAEILSLLDVDAVEEVLSRANGRRGVRRLRSIIYALDPDVSLTSSELERRLLTLCERAGLQRPTCNAWLELRDGPVEVDFLWAGPRLVVETDGHRFHLTRSAFERDRRRDQRLAAAGYRVARFTWRQVADRPGEVIDTLRALL